MLLILLSVYTPTYRPPSTPLTIFKLVTPSKLVHRGDNLQALYQRWWWCSVGSGLDIISGRVIIIIIIIKQGFNK